MRTPRRALLALAALAACSGPQARTKKSVAELLSAGDYRAAAAEIESRVEEYGAANYALYHLDLGLALHYAGRHAESARSLQAAERRIEELYTKSVSAAAGRLLANENIQEYRGHASDRAFALLFDALNHVHLGKPESALVSVRRMESYLDELGRSSDGRRRYTGDGLAHYLAALLHAEAGKADDARVSWELARATYARHRERYGLTPPSLPSPEVPAGMGELVLLHYNGPAPRKISVASNETAAGDAPAPAKDAPADAPAAAPGAQPGQANGLTGAAKRAAGATVKAAGATVKAAAGAVGGAMDLAGEAAKTVAGTLLRTAHPEYVQDPFQTAASELETPEGAVASELYADFFAVASRDLEDELLILKTRSTLRATLKLAAQAATGVDAAGSEFADVRSWSTLPSQIRMARKALPPGRYEPTIRYRDAAGRELLARKLPPVEIVAGRRSWLWDKTTL